MKSNNKKGQALIEFVLILPILIFMILAFIDIGKLMILKNHLESLLSDINIKTESIKDLEYEIKFTREEKGEEVVVTLESCLDVTTPGLGKIIGDPACVTTSKIIKKE